MPYITKTQAFKKKVPKNSLQTILIPRKFGLEKARDWLYDHRTTKNYFCFWQEHPIIGSSSKK